MLIWCDRFGLQMDGRGQQFVTRRNGLEYNQQQKFMLAWPKGVNVMLLGRVLIHHRQVRCGDWLHSEVSLCLIIHRNIWDHSVPNDLHSDDAFNLPCRLVRFSGRGVSEQGCGAAMDGPGWVMDLQAAMIKREVHIVNRSRCMWMTRLEMGHPWMGRWSMIRDLRVGYHRYKS